jgi:hypothetical protein
MNKLIKDRINRHLANLSKGTVSLQTFLDEASKLDKQLALALEGIYCGEEGRIHEAVPGTKWWIAMGWYSRIAGKPIVEYAYLS